MSQTQPLAQAVSRALVQTLPREFLYWLEKFRKNGNDYDANKADRVEGATEGHIAALDSAGNLVDVNDYADENWAMTNKTSVKNLDCNDTTIHELADVLATLIDVLIDRGVLGD
jgi:hypothetical protein